MPAPVPVMPMKGARASLPRGAAARVGLLVGSFAVCMVVVASLAHPGWWDARHDEKTRLGPQGVPTSLEDRPR